MIKNQGKSPKINEKQRKTPKIGKNSWKSIKIWLKWTKFRVRGFPVVRSTWKSFLAPEKFSKKYSKIFFENFWKFLKKFFSKIFQIFFQILGGPIFSRKKISKIFQKKNYFWKSQYNLLKKMESLCHQELNRLIKWQVLATKI